MRTLLLASAALLLAGGSAFAQNATGNPRSSGASNIDGSDTHSQLAPQLPVPGQTGSAEDYLQRAERALRSRQTGAAQEALERAETRLLDRSTSPQMAGQPDSGPRIDAINRALRALAARDMHGALQDTQQAMAVTGGNGGTMTQGAAAGSVSGGSMGNAETSQGNGATMGTGGMSGGTETTPAPAAAANPGYQGQMNLNPQGGNTAGNGNTGPAQ
jgi:hypothetical protein